MNTPGSAADPIYEGIREKILSGTLEAGSRLRQEEIASLFGVSKIPVREALRRLEIEQLVVFEKNKGATVRSYSDLEILQYLDVRIALECLALEKAIPNMIESDFADLQEIQTQYASSQDLHEWSALNVRFHQTLYEPCGNAPLLSMIRDIQQRLGRYLRLLVTTASGFERPVREHQEILDLCRRQETQAAVSILRAHITTTQKEVAAFLRRER